MLRFRWWFRLFVSTTSIVLFALMVWLANAFFYQWSRAWCMVVDLAFWVLALLSLYAGFLELLLFSWETSAFSTLLLACVGVVVVLVSRLGASLYALLVTSFSTQVFGGSIVDEKALGIASLSIFGATLIFGSVAISTLFRGPLVITRGPTLSSLAAALWRVFSRAPPKALMTIAFLVGFLTRLYPEVRYGGLPIGWDTLEYISNARDFAYEPRLLTSYIWLGDYRNLPPLLTWVPGLLAMVGLDPLYLYKVYSPLVTGAVAALAAGVAYRLSRSRAVALAASLIAVFHPFIVGQTQQWHRHVLGTALLLLYIYLIHSGAGPRRRAAALLVASLSYELAAVVALIQSIAELYLSRGRREKAYFTLPAAVSALLLLFYAGYPRRPIVAVTPSAVSFAGTATYSLINILSDAIICLLLLAPHSPVIAMWRGLDRRVRVCVFVLFAAFVAPVVSTVSPVEMHRWFTMLLTITTPLAAVALAKIDRKLLAIYTVAAILAGVAYVFTDLGYTHFRITRGGIPSFGGYPWRLAPSVENLTEAKTVAEIIRDLNTTTLIALDYYPQIHLFIRNPVNLVPTSTQPDLPLAVATIMKTNTSRVALVTNINAYKQLEQFKESPAQLNLTLKLYNIEANISIDSIACEAIYKGTTLNIYMIYINNSSVEHIHLQPLSTTHLNPQTHQNISKPIKIENTAHRRILRTSTYLEQLS